MERLFGPGPAEPFLPEAVLPRTALRVVQGRARHLDAHLQRLADGAAALGWKVPWLGPEIGAMTSWIDALSTGLEALRLRLSPQSLWASLESVPSTPSPYHLLLRPHPLERGNPLAPHKGLTGAWSRGALAEARHADYEDLLLHWPDGVIAETAIAGVALQRDRELLLPPMEGRVASLAERLDLPEWAAARGLVLRVEPFTSEDLAGRRLWCFNAVRGVWPGIVAA